MTHYVGLDVHKRFIVACALTPEGKVAFRRRFDCTPEAIVQFGKTELKREDQVALEVTTHSLSVAQFLAPFVQRVVVSNPTRTKAIAQATVKTDSVDAKTLADLLRSDYLPEVWQPDPQIADLRSLVSLRAQLSRARTRYINRIRSILLQLMIELPARRMDADAARNALKTIQLPDCEQLQVDTLLRLIDHTQTGIEGIDAKLAVIAETTLEIKLLMTLPGVGVLGAAALWAAIGDIHRFKTSNHLAGYLGLAPRVKQSGDHTWYGSITKAGSTEARRLLVLAAHHLQTHQGPLGEFYRRLRAKKHGSIAAVAAARKIAEVAFHMLTNNEPYRYAKPDRTQTKLNNLHKQASGTPRPRRKVEVKPENEADRPTEPGFRREVRPALNEVYEAIGLPTIQWGSLGPGELKATKTSAEYVSSLQRTYAIYRRTRKKPPETS